MSARIKHVAAALAFGYEAFALLTDKLPPITWIATHTPALFGVVVGVLAFHLHSYYVEERAGNVPA